MRYIELEPRAAVGKIDCLVDEKIERTARFIEIIR